MLCYLVFVGSNGREGEAVDVLTDELVPLSRGAAVARVGGVQTFAGDEVPVLHADVGLLLARLELFFRTYAEERTVGTGDGAVDGEDDF